MPRHHIALPVRGHPCGRDPASTPNQSFAAGCLRRLLQPFGLVDRVPGECTDGRAGSNLCPCSNFYANANFAVSRAMVHRFPRRAWEEAHRLVVQDRQSRPCQYGYLGEVAYEMLFGDRAYGAPAWTQAHWCGQYAAGCPGSPCFPEEEVVAGPRRDEGRGEALARPSFVSLPADLAAAAARFIDDKTLDEESTELVARRIQQEARQRGGLYSQFPAYRIQVANGTMFALMVVPCGRRVGDLRSLHLLRQLLELHEIAPLPEVDFVFATGDHARIPLELARPDGGCLPVFSHAYEGTPPRCQNIPLPDYSFDPVGFASRWTEHWEVMRVRMLAAATANPWTGRMDTALFAGTLWQGSRQQGKSLASDPHLGLNFSMRKWGQRGGTVPLEEHCRHKYLVHFLGLANGAADTHPPTTPASLHSPSVWALRSSGYSNRLKYLLLCGSTVIYVGIGAAKAIPHEFYEAILTPGTHFAYAETASDLPAVMARLRSDEALARRIAQTGQAAMRRLDWATVKGYTRYVLNVMSSRQRARTGPASGMNRIGSLSDLESFTRLDS